MCLLAACPFIQDLWTLPEVLVVHLKRFCYTRSHREKLCTPVNFPLEGLDLSRYLLRPQGVAPIYDCYAVSNHFGGLGGGHYTAYCKMPDSGRWYCYDDSHVTPVEESDVMSPAAYVLFYRRRAEAASDPPNLLQELIEARAQQVCWASRGGILCEEGRRGALASACSATVAGACWALALSAV